MTFLKYLIIIIFFQALCVACANSGVSNNIISPLTVTIEAEQGFKNKGEQRFTIEERDFYSNGAAIKIAGSAPVDSMGKVQYELNSKLTPGVYDLVVHYVDENDGHSLVNIYIGKQKYTIVFDEDTESGFESAANMRSALIKSVNINENDNMLVQGQVSRYQSDHKELVRIDKFVFTSR